MLYVNFSSYDQLNKLIFEICELNDSLNNWGFCYYAEIYFDFCLVRPRGVFRGAMGAQPHGKLEALIFRRVSAPNRGWAPPPIKERPISTAPLSIVAIGSYYYVCFMILFNFKFRAVIYVNLLFFKALKCQISFR